MDPQQPVKHAGGVGRAAASPAVGGMRKLRRSACPPLPEDSTGKSSGRSSTDLGLSAEDHRRRFRGSKLGPAERPFVFAQQLKDAGDQVAARGVRRRWTNAGEDHPGAACGGAPSRRIELCALSPPGGPSRGHHLGGRTFWPSSPGAGHRRGWPASPGGPTPTPRRGPTSGPPHYTPTRPSPRPRTTYVNNRPSPLPPH